MVPGNAGTDPKLPIRSAGPTPVLYRRGEILALTRASLALTQAVPTPSPPHPSGPPPLLHLIHHPLLHHKSHLPHRMHILHRITLHRDNIRPFPRLDRS